MVNCKHSSACLKWKHVCQVLIRQQYKMFLDLLKSGNGVLPWLWSPQQLLCSATGWRHSRYHSEPLCAEGWTHSVWDRQGEKREGESERVRKRSWRTQERKKEKIGWNSRWEKNCCKEEQSDRANEWKKERSEISVAGTGKKRDSTEAVLRWGSMLKKETRQIGV